MNTDEQRARLQRGIDVQNKSMKILLLGFYGYATLAFIACALLTIIFFPIYPIISALIFIGIIIYIMFLIYKTLQFRRDGIFQVKANE